MTPRPIDSIRLVGGRPAVDFVNTIHDRFAANREDYLSDYERYVGWSARAGLVTGAEARALGRLEPPASLLREVRRLREQLHAIFEAIVEEREPDGDALAGLEGWLQRAWRGLRLDPGSPGWLGARAEAMDGTLPLQRVALSALDVLQHCAPGRLKRCAAAGECGWLFVDDTKNNRRRWCSMDVCGVKEKMHRYRSRQG